MGEQRLAEGLSGGPLGLVGGNEFHPPARDLDAYLLELAGSDSVAILPTASAKNAPAVFATARSHFKKLGANVVELPVLNRREANEEAVIDVVRDQSFLYIGGGSPRFLYRVLDGSALWEAILARREAGAVVAGSSAGAMIFAELMLVPKWARSHPGFGILPRTLVLPHHDAWIRRVRRVVDSPEVRDLSVIGIDECTGLILNKGTDTVLGPGRITKYINGRVVGELV